MGDRPKRKAAQVPSDQPAPQKRKRPVCSLTGFRSDSTPRFGWRTADSAAPRCCPSTCQCVVARRARAASSSPPAHHLDSGCRMWGIVGKRESPMISTSHHATRRGSNWDSSLRRRRHKFSPGFRVGTAVRSVLIFLWLAAARRGGSCRATSWRCGWRRRARWC